MSERSVEPVVTASDLSVTHVTPAGEVHALVGASLELYPGELVVLIGPSGAGKTTLLHVLGGIETASSGSARVGEVVITDASERDLDRVRREDVAFIFQSFGLLDALTAAENVEIPLSPDRTGRARRAGRGAPGAGRPGWPCRAASVGTVWRSASARRDRSGSGGVAAGAAGR